MSKIHVASAIAVVVASVALGVLCQRWLAGRKSIVQYPVVFVHGFGNKGTTWLNKGYHQLAGDGEWFQYAGNLVIDSEGVRNELDSSVTYQAPYPLFSVSLAKRGFGPIDESGRELGEFVEFVKRETRSRQVILVGFSMGGIVCREYLTSPKYAGDVYQLITVSSPHLGSEFAVCYDIYKKLWAESQQIAVKTNSDVPEEIVKTWIGGVRRAVLLECCEQMLDFGKAHHLSFRASALQMLHPPRDGNYLDELNRRPHPADVRYSCIITVKSMSNASLRDFYEDAQRLVRGEDIKGTTLSACVANLLRVASGCLPGTAQDGVAALAGDGFVSEASQNLRNVAFFKKSGVPVEVKRVQASHLQETLQKDLVSLIILTESVGQTGRLGGKPREGKKGGD
jgi:pimeloyl-ACP methyl ester carboxylesterase